ncbi:MAG TPA: hypothetical protein VIM89_13105 [Mucilaginibacter sp.]
MTKTKRTIYFISVSVVLGLILMLTAFTSIKKLYIITFHRSGTIWHFNNKGQLNGEVDTYINGEIKSREFFKDGKRDGPNIMYYPSGRIELKSFRKNDKVEGMEYEYYEDGSLRLLRNWVNDRPYGDFFYYYPNKKLEIYHTYDILGDKFYLCRYDQSGKVLRRDGYVFSSRTYTKYNDSAVAIMTGKAYKSIKDLYITVANPPQITPEIKVMINNKLCQDLIFPDRNTVLIRNAFSEKGLYTISVEGVFAGKSDSADYTTGTLRIIKE